MSANFERYLTPLFISGAFLGVLGNLSKADYNLPIFVFSLITMKFLKVTIYLTHIITFLSFLESRVQSCRVTRSVSCSRYYLVHFDQQKRVDKQFLSGTCSF